MVSITRSHPRTCLVLAATGATLVAVKILKAVIELCPL